MGKSHPVSLSAVTIHIIGGGLAGSVLVSSSASSIVSTAKT
jgi:hypothetical protein